MDAVQDMTHTRAELHVSRPDHDMLRVSSTVNDFPNISRRTALTASPHEENVKMNARQLLWVMVTVGMLVTASRPAFGEERTIQAMAPWQGLARSSS